MREREEEKGKGDRRARGRRDGSASPPRWRKARDALGREKREES